VTGIPPWSFNYTNGLNTYSVNTIFTTPYLINTNTAGIYQVFGVQDLHCSGSSTGSATVEIYPRPETPSIHQDVNTLYSDSPLGNQWYMNNQMISGATAQIYEATENGLYFDIITQDGCTSDTSNLLDVVITGVQNEIENRITLYPNPAWDGVKLKVCGFAGSFMQLTLTSNTGEKVYSERFTGNKTANELPLDIKPFKPGIYLLKIDTGSEIMCKKMIILRK
jgi:hypothetical protein